MSESIQNSHTSVLPVYSHALAPGATHVIYMSTTTNVGQLVTIRDMDGYLSTPQSIAVSTTTGVLFADTSDNPIIIQQGFGYLTLRSVGPAAWVRANENAFRDSSGNYVVRGVAYSTLAVVGDVMLKQTITTTGAFLVKELVALSTYQGYDTTYTSSLSVRKAADGNRLAIGESALITDSIAAGGQLTAQGALFSQAVSISSSITAPADAAFGSNFTFGSGTIEVAGQLSTSYATTITGSLSTGGYTTFSTSARTTKSLFVSTLSTNALAPVIAQTNSFALSNAIGFVSRTDIPITDNKYSGPTNPVVFTTLGGGIVAPAVTADTAAAAVATTSTLQVTALISSAALTLVQLGSAQITNASGSLVVSSVQVGNANMTGSSVLAPGGGAVPLITTNSASASTIAVARSATIGSTIQATSATAPTLNTNAITFSSLNTGPTLLNAKSATMSSLVLSSGIIAPTLTTLSIPYATLSNPNGLITTSTFQLNTATLSNTLIRPQIITTPTKSTFTFSTPLVVVSVARISSAVVVTETTTSSLMATTIRLGSPLSNNPADPYTTISTASGVSTNTIYDYTSGSGYPYQPLQIHASLDRVVNITFNNVSTQTSTCYFTANMTFRNDSSISGVAGLRIVNTGGTSTIMSFNANPYVPFQKLTLSNYQIDQTSVAASNTYYLAGPNTLTLPCTTSEYQPIMAGGIGVSYMALNGNGNTTSWSAVTSPFTSTLAFAWNGSNMWLAGGQSTTHLAYSYNGISWYGFNTTYFTCVNAIAWNGSVWVACGAGTHTMAYSYDGLEWVGLSNTIFSSNANAVAWNGSMWVAGGCGTGNTLGYSYDGITWVGLGRSTFTNQANGIAWGASTNTWVATGGPSSIQLAYSYNGTLWTPAAVSTFVGPNSYGYCVGWNGSQFVAGGDSNIVYSPDGKTWTKVGVSSIMSTIRAVTWSGTQWCIGGTFTTHALATSSNATSWTGVTQSTLFNTTYALATRATLPIDLSGTDRLYGGQQSLSYAQVPSIWTATSASLSSVNAITAGPASQVAVGRGTPTDPSGAFLVAVAQNGGIYYSSNSGSTWTLAATNNAKYGVAFNGSMWVAVGDGDPAVYYSSNGISWSAATIPSPGTYASINGVAYGNGRWIATGNTYISTNKVITSTDGITWTELQAAGSLISYGMNIIYANNMWVMISAGAGGAVNAVTYSYDGLTWYVSQSGSANYNNNPNDIAWNGSRFIIVGNTTNAFCISSEDGINWIPVTGANSIITSYVGYGSSVATNGRTWVMLFRKNTGPVLLGLMYSLDGGDTWTEVTGLDTTIEYAFNVRWNGYYFIATGYVNAQPYNIIRSADGITWSGVALISGKNMWTLACRVPIPVLSPKTILTSVNQGLTWRITDQTNIFTEARAAAWNGYLWVAVGDANTHAIAYSWDGLSWTGVTGTSLATGFRLVAWNGASWFVYGTGANTIATSPDGLAWTGQGAGTAPTTCVAYNGSNLWVGGSTGANTLLTSANGIAWTGLSNTTFNTIVRSVAWNGTIWTAVGGTNITIATSPNGTTWTAQTADISGGSSVVWTGKMWVVGAGLSNTQLAAGKFLVAGGAGTNRLGYSTDGGLTWTASANGNSVCTYEIFGVAWNGSIWVAVGSNNPGGAVAYSSNGISWTASANAASLIGQFATCVAWNGTRWIVGANGYASGNYRILYSTDGNTWTGSSTANSIFSSDVNGIFWNGSLFVATGAYNGFSGAAVGYSADGITWIAAPSAHTNTAINGGRCVAWNGKLWLVGGIGSSNSLPIIIYSYDAVAWYEATNARNILGAASFPTIYSLGWNGSKFVAGSGGTSNTYVYSPDGFVWSASTNGNSFQGFGFGLTWTGQRWLAAGYTTPILQSPDGVTWSTTNAGSVFNSEVRALASKLSPLSPPPNMATAPTAGTAWSTFAVDSFTGSQKLATSAPLPYGFADSNIMIAGSSNATYPFAISTDGRTWVNPNGISWNIVGNISIVSPTSITKSTGVNTWDAVAYSSDSYKTNVYMSFKSTYTTFQFMAGFSETPAASTNYTNMNYGFFCTDTGSLSIYESGTLIGTFGTYDSTTNLKIIYDGTNIGYYVNNSLVRGVARAPGNRLYLFIPLAQPGCVLNTIQYGSTDSATLAKIKAISWNGRFWTLGLGNSPALRILTSSFTLSTPTLNSWQLTSVYGIAWGPQLGILVGTGYSQTNYATTADGGLSWTGAPGNPTGNPYYFFSGAANGVAFGGNLFVAVGEDLSSPSLTRGIRYSPNGQNWSTPSTTAGRGIALGCAVAYHSSIWVVGGSTISGTNDTLAVSANGSNWSFLSNTTFAVAARGIAWGSSNFVAVGEGTNTIAYSANGSNWTGLGTGIFSTRGHSVAWNGRYFVALGEGTNTMATSSDGITWTGVGTTTFDNMSGGGAVASRSVLPIQDLAAPPLNVFTPAKTFNWSVTGITEVSSTSVQKPAGGASAWDSRARSLESVTASAYLSFTASQTTAAIMMGLSENPTSTTSFTALNYALSVTATGTLQIYELGTLIQTIGTYTTTDTFKITYDGTTIRYFQNATLLRSVSRAVGAPLFLSSSFFTPGGTLAAIEFHALYTLSASPPAFSTSAYAAESSGGTDANQFSPFYLTLNSDLLPSQWSFYLSMDGDLAASNTTLYGDIFIGETKYFSTNYIQPVYTTSPSTYVLSFSNATSIAISTPSYLSLRLKATRGSGNTFLYTSWSNAAGTQYNSSIATTTSYNPNAIEYLQFFHSNANTGLQTSELDLYVTIGSTLTTTYINPSTGMEFNRGFMRWNTTLNGTTIENRFNDITTRSLTYTGAIYNASDPLAKEEICSAETEPLYATIRSLPLRRYTFMEPYLTKYGLRDRRQIGVLATEVKTTLPHAVVEGPAPLEGLSSFQMVDRSQLQYAHMGATQGLMARIAALQMRIRRMLA